MKQISITYNPYLISTDIKVDGESPKSDSALIVGKKRLQEWVEKLPQIIIEEYRDRNVKIDFTGSISDYEDVVSAFEGSKDEIISMYSSTRLKI